MAASGHARMSASVLLSDGYLRNKQVPEVMQTEMRKYEIREGRGEHEPLPAPVGGWTNASRKAFWATSYRAVPVQGTLIKAFEAENRDAAFKIADEGLRRTASPDVSGPPV